jgi:stage V sporulation protein SpoVS
MGKGPRKKPGEVRDAILAFLRQEGEADVAAIQAAVESAAGAPVARSSVQSFLQLNTGGLFERPSRGRYRLKRG